jgi:hypothetical protein
MKGLVLSVTLLLLGVSFSGCVATEETNTIEPENQWIEDEKQWIEDEEDIIELVEEGICGDLDGDGELDCPLSGYTPGTNPWWCNSTGIGGHHVDPAYNGMEKGPLSEEECELLTAEFQDAIDWASQWPTLGEAEAEGYHMTVGYTNGMGTHHAMLGEFRMGDDDFNADIPHFRGTPFDTEFNHSRPEFLMYAGEEPESELVGFAWYVRSPADSPPEGFTGGNDWWHRHESLCFQLDEMLVVGENLEDGVCENRGGENVALGDFWMVHAWIVRPWLTHDDVFTNHHPCLTREGAIFDDGADCWDEGAGHVGHEIE